MGILVALIIIVGAVVVGAYYTWNSRVHDRVIAEAAALRELDTMSESTVPEAIEADLAAETPDEFDAELDAAFAELDAAMGAP
jgi:predicted negative regulator of RcsB-dependent stress response